VKLEYWKTEDVDPVIREHRIIYDDTTLYCTPSGSTRRARATRRRKHRNGPKRPQSHASQQAKTGMLTSDKKPGYYSDNRALRTSFHLTSQIRKNSCKFVNKIGASVASGSILAVNMALCLRVVGKRMVFNSEEADEVVKARLYDLWPFTNISARVAVLNSKFQGPSTDVITFTTVEAGR